MSNFSSISTGLADDNTSSVFTQRNPKALNPHSWNCAIYGEDEDVSDLVEMIQASGWVKPLVITPSDTIIAGHRRWKVVLTLGWESIPVEVREFPDETAELETLLLENASRVKTTEQKVREAKAWQSIEKARAKQRQQQAAAMTNRKLGRDSSKTLMENFPQASKGTSRDAIAHRVGLGSGRTYSKAAKIVTQIDEEANLGHLEVAQVLRKVLNEQSVDLAHSLLKKSPQERKAIANLIISGEAKSTKQAVRMVRRNNYAEFNHFSQATLAGFSVGDWVEVNDHVQSHAHIGRKGQVEQIWAVEQQISVSLEGSSDKLRFYPHALTLIAKAPPPNPFRVEDIVFVHIDRQEAASPQQKRWNGCWGRVTKIGEGGSLTVDVGSESLQLFPRDLKPIDAPSGDLRQVLKRVLRLRSFELDEIEEKMLDVLQRREWFTYHQLIHLKNIEQLYFNEDSCDIPTDTKPNGYSAGFLDSEPVHQYPFVIGANERQ